MFKLFFALGLLATSLAQADQKELLVYLSPFPPLVEEAKGSDDTPKGFFPDLYKYLLNEQQGLNFRFEIVPIARYNSLFKAGTVPIGLWPWEFANQNHENLGYMADVEFGILTIKKSVKVEESLGCTTNNTPLGGEHLDLVRHHSFKNCMTLLRKGRIEFILGLKPVLLNLGQQSGLDYFYKNSGALTLYLFMNKEYKSVFPSIRSRIKKLNLKEFNARYGVAYRPESAK